MKSLFAKVWLTLLCAGLTVFASAAGKKAPEAPVAQPNVKAVATGEMAPELPNAIWVYGEKINLADFKGKKPVVLTFWTMRQDAIQVLPQLGKFAKTYAKKAVFIGVVCEDALKLQASDGLKEIGIPIIADDQLSVINRFLRPTDRVPVSVLIDRKGRVVWRNHPLAMEEPLKEIIADKFDLTEAVRKEKFAANFSQAMHNKDYEAALKLSGEELEKHPEDFELRKIRAGIWTKGLKKPESAWLEIKAELKKIPSDVKLYHLALTILRSGKLEKEVPGLYQNLINEFKDKNPLVLLQFANIEISRPMPDNHPEYFCSLVRAAYHSKKKLDAKERTVVIMAYARMCHLAGRPDLAMSSLQEAVKLVGKKEKIRTEIELYINYYHKLTQLSKQLK